MTHVADNEQITIHMQYSINVRMCQEVNTTCTCIVGQFQVKPRDGKVKCFLDFIHKLLFKTRQTPSDMCKFAYSLFLQEYNLDVKHIHGKQDLVANVLSHC